MHYVHQISKIIASLCSCADRFELFPSHWLGLKTGFLGVLLHKHPNEALPGVLGERGFFYLRGIGEQRPNIE